MKSKSNFLFGQFTLNTVTMDDIIIFCINYVNMPEKNYINIRFNSAGLFWHATLYWHATMLHVKLIVYISKSYM